MKYKDIQLVILAAGKATRLFPLTLNTPKCLLSVKQKPAIYNMIIPLIKEGLKDITIIVSPENKEIIKLFNDTIFSDKNIKINYIIQENPKGPGHAFTLAESHINKPTILLLSDTICSIPKILDRSWIAVQKISKNLFKDYCLVDVKNEIINGFIEKPSKYDKEPLAVIGLYYFHNIRLLKRTLKSIKWDDNKELQLSEVFLKYMKKENICIERTKDWEDLGTLEKYQQLSRTKNNCRHFNKLEFGTLGTIKKISEYEKIKSEMNWFKEVENTIFAKVSPKFYENTFDYNSYCIEYYDYLTIMEYFLYYPIPQNNKINIFKDLALTLHSIYIETKLNYVDKKINTNKFKEYFNDILIKKTEDRIKKWDRYDLVLADTIKINNIEYVGYQKALSLLKPSIIKICDTSPDYISIIHGDPSFSNILYSPKSSIFKFIDPRGNFKIDTILGDYRYDFAKLRHCYHGKYDEIINDLFSINEIRDNIEVTYYKKHDYECFDNIINKLCNLDINDIELIESLLFISMIPLHSDYKDRQLAFFSQGIIMLNNQLKKRGLI